MTARQPSMTGNIRYLIFDLGGTLMFARDDWASIHARADAALVHSLQTEGIDLSASVFRAQLSEYYAQRDKDHYETTYHLVLRELLRDVGHGDAPESVLRSALDALFRVTQSNWELEADSAETLASLRSAGYRLGIFSNAGDDRDVQELVDSFGIRRHLDFVLTSAACFYRKPHPRAFEIALAQWNATPDESAMIGDSLEADIFGARQAGMTAVWITRRAEFKNEDLRRIQPDFSIRKLPELMPTLERIAISRR